MRRCIGPILRPNGYSLVELLLVIIVIGILSGIAVKSLRGVNDIARTEETKRELDRLAYAIAGNPNLVSAGVRTDYGYIGDVGALPPNLDALVTNPGSYATWDGPYIKDELSAGGADIYFKSDAWGKAYSYAAGNTVSSSGGSSTITRALATSAAALTVNDVSAVITDINNAPPGITYKDSVDVVLEYPDGTGSMTTSTKNPAVDGSVQFNTIPIGIHKMLVIFTPTNDTLTRYANVDPGLDYFGDIIHYANFGSVPVNNSPEILRPMGAGTTTTLLDENCTGNWSCVDEVTADDDGTFVQGAGGSWDLDTYATENSSVGAGTINSVIVFIRCKNEKVRVSIRTNGNDYWGADITVAGSYTEYSNTWTTNPQTSSAWTWAEIDAMEIGVTIKESGKCTQVWAEVHYTP